jgi:nitric oxide synthase oxygenase domain/subunit
MEGQKDMTTAAVAFFKFCERAQNSERRLAGHWIVLGSRFSL